MKIDILQTERSFPTVLQANDILAKSCHDIGVEHKLMNSGASHDAQSISDFGIPTGMILVPSRNGISHAPDEYTKLADITAGTKILLETLMSNTKKN